GEIVALYGLIGSGAADVALAVYGIAPADAGTLAVDGRGTRVRSPDAADRLGIALLPADRKREGLFALHSVSFNVSAGNLARVRRGRWFTGLRAERLRVTALAGRLRIKTT